MSSTGKAGQPIVILNPAAAAGRGEARWQLVEPIVTGWREPPRIVRTEGPGDASRIARRARDAACPMVVAAGGDGTAHEVVQGLLGAEGNQGSTSFAYLPLGTGCDFARGLGLAEDASAIARDLAAGADERHVDVGRIELLESGRGDGGSGEPCRRGDGGVRYFLNAANVGLGPAVALRVSRSRWLRRMGGSAYLLAAVERLLRARPIAVRWAVDGGEPRQEPLLNLSVCNGPSFGGGMRPCQGATLESGSLDVAFVGPMGFVSALFQMPRLMDGRRLDHPAIRLFRCRTIEIEPLAEPAEPLDDVAARSGFPVEADGELTASLPARISVVPGGLRVRAPARQQGAPRAGGSG